MPLFHYKARDKFGALFEGTIETVNREFVATQLDGLGYIPVSITEEKEGLFSPEFLQQFTRITPQDQIIFSRQLATLISAGLPFIASFETLIEQTENPRLKKVIAKVKQDVEGGSTIADALERHPKVFSSLYVNMIRAGEAGGVLDEILNRLAFLAEHEAETRARVKAATRYPIIVIAATAIAFVVLMTFVVPRFVEIYANFKGTLPMPTRVLIWLNKFIKGYWYLIIGAIAGLIFGMRWYINTEAGRLQWDNIKIKLPIFGPIFLKLAMSRFSRIFATLNRSGLPILQTLDIVSATIGNKVISRVIDNVRDSARGGKGLVQPMRVSKVFPPIVTRMMAVGEETGNMDEMLVKISDYYDTEVEYAIKNLSTLIEPILIVIIGGMVLFLALGIFLPMWNMISLMKG
ncbi:MAG: type II secretion system F family protein [Nitrospirota bacterium]